MTEPAAHDLANFRLPSGVLERLKQQARQEGVALNHLLEKAIAKPFVSREAMQDMPDELLCDFSTIADAAEPATPEELESNPACWRSAGSSLKPQVRPLSRQEWETIAERWDAVNFAQMEAETAGNSRSEDISDELAE